MVDDSQKGLIVFQGSKIRRTWFNDEWYYSVIDIIAVLTEQQDFQTARKYWNKLSQRLREEGSEVVTNCHRLKLLSPDGKFRETDGASTKSLFRIIQSVPSRKAEPLKLWLAEVGHERIQEIQNPELAQKRMKEIYRAKGYSDDWIEKRVRGIAIRDELTDEWKKRGVSEERDFAILTAETQKAIMVSLLCANEVVASLCVSKATFGMTPSEYKQFKGLKRENLRDHMNDLELIFTMLGERVSTEITRKEDAQGYLPVEDAAKRGGRVAGNARRETEKELERPITSSENYLLHPKKKEKLIKDKR